MTEPVNRVGQSIEPPKITASMTREQLTELRAKYVAFQTAVSNTWNQTVGKIALIDEMLAACDAPADGRKEA